MIKQRVSILINLVVKYVIFFIIIFLLNIWITIGLRNIFDSTNYSSNEINIINLSGIAESEGHYYTINDDPWLIVDYTANNVVELDLSILNEETLDGAIYFANSLADFNEKNMNLYRYQNGKNIISIAGEEVKYLRLDITNKENVIFEINSISSKAMIPYKIMNMDYLLICVIALLLTALLEMVLLINPTRNNIEHIFWAIISISVVLIFGKYLTGDNYYIYNDIGSDTYNQYYPYYVNMVMNIRDGSFSVWNWDYGLGTSILNMNAWTMDPFSIGVVLLGVILGPNMIHILLVWMQIVKIIILYTLNKKFLSYHLNNKFAICFSAYLCAFNGYLLLWGQHYFLGTACIFLLLVLCALEKMIFSSFSKGNLILIIVVASTLIFSYYIGYMILIAAAVYFLYRYFTLSRNKTIKDYIQELWRCLLSVGVGVLISGVVFIPASYYITTNSIRLSYASEGIIIKLWSSFISSFNITEIGTRMSRMLSNNLLYINDNKNAYFANYYEMPQFFCTIFIFFFFGQWIVTEVIRLKENKKWLSFTIKIVLLLLALFSSTVGVLFNAFAYPSYRYTFVLFPIIAIGIGSVLEEIHANKKLSLVGVEIGTVLSIWGWYFSYKNRTIEVRKYVIIVLILLIIGRYLLLAASKYKQYFKYLMTIFMFLTIVTSILDNAITTNYRKSVSNDGYYLEWDNKKLSGNTALAIEWLREYDTSFYRIEKTYSNWSTLADSFIERYSTISWYNSSPNHNLLNFYDNMYNSQNDSIQLFQFNTQLDITSITLVNSKYILSKYELNQPNFTLINTFGDVYVYRNSNTESVAKWYNDFILQSEFDTLDENGKATAIHSKVVLDDIIVEPSNSSALISTFMLKSQTEMVGNITTDGTGIVMLAIPDQLGWAVYDNGVKLETFNANYGFIGFKLEEGTHDIQVRYTIPKIKTGILVSSIGIILAFTIIIIDKKKNNK